MTIKIEIIIDGEDSYYNFEDEKVTLSEVGMAMFQLEKAKTFLKGFEFKSNFTIKEGYDEEEEEP